MTYLDMIAMIARAEREPDTAYGKLWGTAIALTRRLYTEGHSFETVKETLKRKGYKTSGFAFAMYCYKPKADDLELAKLYIADGYQMFVVRKLFHQIGYGMQEALALTDYAEKEIAQAHAA